MKMTKRILAFVLCFAMLVGLMPMAALRAEAAGTLIDAAIFCSDVHGNPSTVTSIFNGIKNADSTFNPSTASFVGDTQCAASSVTSAAQEVYSGVQCIYAFGNHDDEGSYGIDDFTGLSYGDSTTNYYIYTISENSMSSSSPDTSGFTSTVDGLDKTKPLFIISHMPLHARRNDNNGAAAWYEAISAAAESMDIFFFWAHNHTSEGSADTAAYYVAKNGSETISIQGGSTVTPNFTYANAGYIDPPNTPARNNVATAVRIYDDSVNLTVYNASGELSGTYAVNETVTRQFASTDSGDGGSTDATTAPTEGETTTEEKEVYVLVDTMTVGEDYLIANGNSGSVTILGQSGGSAQTATAEVKTSGDYTYIETADSCYVWNATESTNSSASGPRLINDGYAVYYSSGLSVGEVGTATNGAVYTRYWTYSDGQLACVSTNSSSTTYYLTYSDGYSMTSTATDGIYIYEKQTITVSSDGTVSGGGSTEGGDSGEDDTTGGSTETVVGDGTYTTADDGSYQKVTFGTEGEQKTVYVLVSTPTAGKNYIIASGNSAGNVYALKENTTTGTSVTVNAATDSITAPYIENSDNTIVWTASSGMNFKSVNGGYYLNYTQSSSGSNKPGGGGSSSYSLSFSTSSASDWTAGTNCLYREGTSNDYYLRYNSGWTMGGQNSEYNVYFYEEQTIDTSSSVTYSVTASDIEHFYTADTTDTETVTITASVTDGAPTTGTYAYAVMGGDAIITSISEDGVITFNGNEGTAQVKVSYTWAAETDVNEDGTVDENDTYTIWQVIDVTATSPYYTLDLHKANITYVEATGLTEFAEGTVYYTQNEDGTYTQVDTTVTTTPDSSVTYYTLSYTLGEEITAPIAIKGIEEGDRYGVWAVVKYYDGTTEGGTDMGTVGSDIEWTSSDETIATVDKNTGIITFTGKEGTVTITATYKNGNRPSDSVVISVTQSQYTVPNDGTTDFPEYPNEGAIRYDKTATAVGNFSETGIAQVELSMTGVPYTTGSEIDVVLMLDMTGSMTTNSMAAAEAAAKAFADQIVKNEDGTYNKNRISVQVFTTNGVTELWSLSAVTADTYSSLVTAIESASDKQASGGTPYSTALQECYEILYAAKSDGIGNNRSQYCVFVSDGTPTSVTYITNTTTPTTTTTVSFERNNATYTQTVPAYSTGSSASTFYGSTSYHEYWSQLMINNGVTVFGVYTSAAAGSSGSQGSNGSGSGSVNDTTEGTNAMTNVASSSDNVYVVEDYTDTSAVEGALTSVAQKIMQAATDITVEDQITDYYTMIFDIPTGTQTISGVTNDFYIEFLKYTLDSTTHERVDSDNDGDTYDDATSVTKLYLKNTNGVLSAASDSSGTAYAAPVFAQSAIGEKGTLYYWTTDSGYASKAAVSYNDGTNTYYFIPYGMEANEDGTAPEGWYNMTSGAYASGTVDATNMSKDLVIATPYFVYNAETKMIYWTLDKMQDATTEYALRYFLYLDNSATEVGTSKETDPGSYLTNDHAYITYTNFNGNDCRQEFPKPQLTWSGAQVSYVFYLVNAAGQPINKSGQVVDFANATFVTDVYTEHTVWNKGEDGSIDAESQLSIDWLAANLLPTDYKVYDEQASYKLHVYGDHTGESIFDYFIIDGNDAATISSSLNTRLDLSTTSSTVSLTTTKVYNTKAGTKITGYGTYTSEATDKYDDEIVLTNIDFYNTTVAFAVVWQPSLAPDTVVVDYGLDVLINVCQNDLMQDNTISGIGLGRDAYDEIAMNTGISTTSKLGTADLTSGDGWSIHIENDQQIRFSQNDMTFQNAATFYYESAVKYYEDSEQKTGYLHSSVTVIPATTIYYEDEFVDLKTYTSTGNTDENGKTIYNEADGWASAGTASGATQAQDRPGTTLIAGVMDADNNYGYDAAYSSMSTHSLNSAAMVNVTTGKYATAEFTFYGTGFDVISMTSNTTGTLTVKVSAAEDMTAADGTKIKAGTAVKNMVVDTYYGYTTEQHKIVYTYTNGEWVAEDKGKAEGATATAKPETPAEGDTYTAIEQVWVAAPDVTNALYQVPVIKVQDLTYGKYTVTITASYVGVFDHTTPDGYDLYLDAIRIYDPANDGANDDKVKDAYVADGEGWPSYFELRNKLIKVDTFNEGTTEIIGEVFIDGDASVGNAQMADYTSYGPNNEVYLAHDQSIAFLLNTNVTNADGENIVAKIQLGLKSADGSAVTYTIQNIAADGTVSNAKTVTVSTTTDMYYDITGWKDGIIVITNSGESGILSLTNIKATYTEDPNASAVAAASLDEVEDTVAVASETSEVYAYMTPAAATLTLRSLNRAAVVEPEETEPETTEPETTEPEETEPEVTEPEETEPETTEPETTEPEETEPEQPSTEEVVKEIVKEIIKAIGSWLGKWF